MITLYFFYIASLECCRKFRGNNNVCYILYYFIFFLLIFSTDLMLEVATSRHLFISPSEGATSLLLRVQHLSF